MIYKLPSIESADLQGRIVAIRINVDTLIKGSAPEQNQTIKSSIETINYLIKHNCKIILMGSYGNPNGTTVDELSLMDARFALGHLLNKPTKFVDVMHSLNSIKFMNPGEILVLENLRFHPGEENHSKEDCEKMLDHIIKQIEIFVIDTLDFNYQSCSVKLLSKTKPTYIGFNISKELEKVKDKLNTKEEGKRTLILGDEELENVDKEILQKFINKFDYIYSAKSIKGSKPSIIKTVDDLKQIVEKSSTVIWLGTLEKDTQDVLEYLSLSVGKEVVKILGGRNLVEYLNHNKFKEKGINFISTSGANLINILLGREIKLN